MFCTLAIKDNPRAIKGQYFPHFSHFVVISLVWRLVKKVSKIRETRKTLVIFTRNCAITNAYIRIRAICFVNLYDISTIKDSIIYIHLHCKSMDWFLYDKGLHQKELKYVLERSLQKEWMFLNISYR